MGSFQFSKKNRSNLKKRNAGEEKKEKYKNWLEVLPETNYGGNVVLSCTMPRQVALPPKTPYSMATYPSMPKTTTSVSTELFPLNATQSAEYIPSETWLGVHPIETSYASTPSPSPSYRNNVLRYHPSVTSTTKIHHPSVILNRA